MLQCVAVCCSVLQFVAVCCSVLQCDAVCCSVLEPVRYAFVKYIWETHEEPCVSYMYLTNAYSTYIPITNMFYTCTGSAATIHLLVHSYRANIGAVDVVGSSALHFAALAGRLSCVEQLLGSGADVMVRVCLCHGRPGICVRIFGRLLCAEQPLLFGANVTVCIFVCHGMRVYVLHSYICAEQLLVYVLRG